MLSALAPLATTSAAPPVTIRASISSTGEEGNALSYGDPVSADGRFVAFRPFAFNLVEEDNNADFIYQGEIYLYMILKPAKKLASIDPLAGKYNYFSSFTPRISDTGCFISFSSDSSNLVPGNNNDGTGGYGVYDAFVSRLW